MTIPKKFEGVIYCSAITAKLAPHPNMVIVKPGWQDDMFFFKTNHIPGSIGVYYDNTLHIGENRLTLKQIDKILDALKGRTVKKIVYDNYLEHTSLWQETVPTYRQSQNMLKKYVGSKKAHIVLRHIGMVQILPKSWSYQWHREPSSERENIMVRATDHLTFTRNAKVTLYFESIQEHSIIPGLAYFSHFSLPLNEPHIDSNGDVHIPFACHGDSNHYNYLKALYPNAIGK